VFRLEKIVMDRLGVIERKPICAIVVIGLLCSLAIPGCRRHEDSSAVATTQLDHDASSKAAPWSYQIDRIKNLHPRTNRPIQAKNDRPVKFAE